MAINAPRGTPPSSPAYIPETGKSRSEDMAAQADTSMQMDPEGDVEGFERSDLRLGEDFEKVSKEEWMKEWAGNVNFSKDEMIVVVAESNNPNDEARPYISVNGDAIYFERGVPTKCRRYHVETLARAQTRSVRTVDTNSTTGADRYKVQRQSVLKYPFEVKQDPRGARGRAWLQDVLRQA